MMKRKTGSPHSGSRYTVQENAKLDAARETLREARWLADQIQGWHLGTIISSEVNRRTGYACNDYEMLRSHAKAALDLWKDLGPLLRKLVKTL